MHPYLMRHLWERARKGDDTARIQYIQLSVAIKLCGTRVNY